MTVPEEILEADITRLKKIQEGMWKLQVTRLREKAGEDWTRGSYQDVKGKLIMENLGKNLVQFCDALVLLNENNTLKQGSDMLNLVLMLIDKGTHPDRFGKDSS